jgi:hypothetical protein
MRWVSVWWDLVMLRNVGVYAKDNRRLFGRHVCQPHRAVLALDANPRRVNDLSDNAMVIPA